MDMTGQALALRLREAVDSGVLGLWDLRPELEKVLCSPQWKRRLGFPVSAGADSTHFWRCRVHPDDLPGMMAAMDAHTNGSEARYEATFRLRSNGSGYRLVRSRGRVIERGADGRGTRMVGTLVDLTPRPCTPGGGLPDDPRLPVAGAPTGLAFHELVNADAPGRASDTAVAAATAAERKRVLALVDEVVRDTLAQLQDLGAL